MNLHTRMKPVCHSTYTKETFMNLRTSTHLLILLALLVGGLSQTTPVRALALNNQVIWCPAAVLLPESRKNGCTPAFDKMGDLLTALANRNPATAGVVWIGN